MRLELGLRAIGHRAQSIYSLIAWKHKHLLNNQWDWLKQTTKWLWMKCVRSSLGLIDLYIYLVKWKMIKYILWIVAHNMHWYMGLTRSLSIQIKLKNDNYYLLNAKNRFPLLGIFIFSVICIFQTLLQIRSKQPVFSPDD